MCSGKGLSKARERVQSVSRLQTFGFSNTIPHIGSTRNCGMILKLERLSHAPIKPVFWVRLSYWAWVPIIGAFVENRCVAEKGLFDA